MFTTARIVSLCAVFALSFLEFSSIAAESDVLAPMPDLTVTPEHELLLSQPQPTISASLKHHFLHGIGHLPPSNAKATIRWAAGDIQSHQGALWPVEGRIVLRAGGAVAVDNAVVTVIRDIDGSLTLNSGNGPTRWTVTAGNHGRFFAKSQFNTATGALGFVLPVLFSHDGYEIPATIYIAYVVADDEMSFRKAWIGLPLLAESGQTPPIENLTLPQLRLGPKPLPSSKAEPENIVKRSDGRGGISGALEAFLEPGIPLAPWCDEIDQITQDEHAVVAKLVSDQGFGRFENLNVNISITPGPSFLEGNQILNLLNGATGTITARIAGKVESLPFAQSHRGNRIAQSVYQPGLRRLTLDIPVQFGTDSGQAAYGDLQLDCDMSRDTAGCAAPVGLKLATSRPLVNLFGDAGPMSTSSADLNCTGSCPRCSKNGCTNCQLIGCPSGGFCPAEHNPANCCQGALRCACRNCGEPPP